MPEPHTVPIEAPPMAAAVGWRPLVALRPESEPAASVRGRLPAAPTDADGSLAAQVGAHDPYGFLDIEPDFAWHSADGRRAFVSSFDEGATPPDWLTRSAGRRKRDRVVNVASWLVTGAVLAGVVAGAGVAMLGADRFGAAVREVTGFDIDASHPTAPVAPAKPAAAFVTSAPAPSIAAPSTAPPFTATPSAGVVDEEAGPLDAGEAAALAPDEPGAR